MTTAVRAEGIAKSYWIPRADAPRWREYLRRPSDAARRAKRMEVRALEEISFDAAEGEVLGIIGRNGAGKSTLLKILSRITSPTSGRVTMRGRVASLLEVGTGFHPDLSGRENVYLNGMLLGMPSSEVDRVYDAICEFAGVGAYINVPIKRYSSGMQLRLAFAVAAHLAADTMIIDEVLAVGDAEFQRKCLGTMRDVSRNGRTTLFVSHNMSAVESLCTRVLWLDKGRVKQVGMPEHVIREYLAAGLGLAGQSSPVSVDMSGMPRGWTLGMARLERLSFERHSAAFQRPPWHAAFGESFSLRIEFALQRAMPDFIVGIGIRNERGEDVLTSHSADAGAQRASGNGRRAHLATVTVSQPWLRPGTYYIEAAILSGTQLLDHVRDVAVLVVDEQAVEGAPPLALKKGPVSPVWKWDVS